jgi:hypothetical protein
VAKDKPPARLYCNSCGEDQVPKGRELIPISVLSGDSKVVTIKIQVCPECRTNLIKAGRVPSAI